MKCCLTIAGADSGGGAGVEADLRTFHAYGVHGCTVHTAITAQNPMGVSGIHYVPTEFVAAQLDAVLGVYDIAALKTGMLSDVATAEVIADRFAAHPEIKKVIDPVMIATSGRRLTNVSAVDVVIGKMMPQATLITPNLPEAEELARRWCRNVNGQSAEELARILNSELGVAILVKGGHAEGGDAVDVLFDGREVYRYSMPRVREPASTHGTGCSFASAVAAELSQGRDLQAAVAGAKRYVHDAIAGSYFVGSSCGVLGWASRL